MALALDVTRPEEIDAVIDQVVRELGLARHRGQ